MKTETKEKLVSWVRITVGAAVSVAGSFGLKLDPGIVSSVIYVAVIAITTFYVGWKTNPTTAGSVFGHRVARLVNAGLTSDVAVSALQGLAASSIDEAVDARTNKVAIEGADQDKLVADIAKSDANDAGSREDGEVVAD